MSTKETKKETGLATTKDNEALAALRNSYPVEAGFVGIQLPRISLVSQDVTEEVKNAKTGKKEIKVITEAGTFFTERQSDDVDEDGKKVWVKDELGTSIQGIIIYKRKQLRFYDESTEMYTSSPVFDTDDEIIPLFCDKKEVDRGTAAELRARDQYQGKTAKGKPTSKLEDNRVLYILFNDELFQTTVRGTSMYSFKSYERDLNKSSRVPAEVLTDFSSEPQENGATKWNKMTFSAARPITSKELKTVMEKVGELRSAVEAQKAAFRQGADAREANAKADRDFEGLTAGTDK